MIIGIGSKNPVKVSAAKSAMRRIARRLQFVEPLRFRALAVESGVSGQPFSEVETKLGATNRATAVLARDPKIDLAISMEGGVQPEGDELFTTVWVCVMDRRGHTRHVNGARFVIATDLAQKIHSGLEMGDALDELHGRKNLKQQEGMIGVATGGAITRKEEYQHLVELAVALWMVETK